MTTTIMLVEDEPDDALFFERALKKAGVTSPLRVAKGGREALDYLQGVDTFKDRELYPLPCMVVLDLNLPHATGFEVLEQIRQHPELRNLVVIVLTSSASDADIAKAYSLGANAYLVKPSDSSQLVDMVQAIKHFWLTYNCLPHTSGTRPPPAGGLQAAS